MVEPGTPRVIVSGTRALGTVGLGLGLLGFGPVALVRRYDLQLQDAGTGADDRGHEPFCNTSGLMHLGPQPGKCGRNLKIKPYIQMLKP